MIVSISGKMHSGKDTVGIIWQYLSLNKPDLETEDQVQRLLNKTNSEYISLCSNWHVKRWATKVKQVAGLILNVDPKKFEDQDFKDSKMDDIWGRYKIDTAIGYNLYVSKADVINAYKNLEYLKEEDWEEIYYIPTYRDFLQWIGTDAFRDIIHPDIWVNALMGEYVPEFYAADTGEKVQEKDGIRWVNTKYPNWLITDTRFPNEGQRIIDDKCGFNIRVERERNLRFPILTQEYLNKGAKTTWKTFLMKKNLYSKIYHESETALDDWNKWDFTIRNNGSLITLANQVKNIYKKLI